MKNSQTIIVITTLILTLTLSLLTQAKSQTNLKHKSSHQIAPTHAPTNSHTIPRPSQSPSPANSPNIHKPKPKSSQPPTHAPKSAHTNPNTAKSPSPTKSPYIINFKPKSSQTHSHTNPKTTQSPSPTNSPNIHNSKPKSSQTPTHKNADKNPKPTQSPSPTNSPNNLNSKPKSSTPPSIKKNETSPYHFVNEFCLSRRLDVQRTFCLKVLRSSPTSSKAQTNKDLILIAANNAIDFANKTLLFLTKLSKDKNSPKPVIEECLSAYKGCIAQYNVLKQEAKSETRVASYDAELAKNELNRCVKVVSGTKISAKIGAQNEIALDYAKLTLNIADSTN